MKKQRKHNTPEEKVAILRWQLVEGVPAGRVTDETDYFRLADDPGVNGRGGGS